MSLRITANSVQFAKPCGTLTSITAFQRRSYRMLKTMESGKNCRERQTWNPVNLFERPSNYKYAVLVLNRPIELKKNIMLPLWENAQVTITVDGGTDRWMKYLDNLANDVFTGKSTVYAPKIITGDMDSIMPDTRDKLKAIGVRVIETPDQDHTDYTKGLMELAKHCKSENLKLDGVYVIVDSSGRFDHIIANINTLYQSLEIFEDTQVFQIASDSLTWLLRAGKHRIIIPKELTRANSWCGLLPLGSRIDKTVTTGLKWNLENTPMGFGGMVSTSNTYKKDCTEVTVDVNDVLVWTMGIEPLVENC